MMECFYTKMLCSRLDVYAFYSVLIFNNVKSQACIQICAYFAFLNLFLYSETFKYMEVECSILNFFVHLGTLCVILKPRILK